MIQATFVMEQHIGHLTYYENLRRFVDAASQIEANWVEIAYHVQGSIWKRLPILPAGIRGTLMGREQVRRGLRSSVWDIALFNTQVPAVFAGRYLSKRPYILCTDITPVQYDQMGDEYGHKPDRNRLLRRYKHQVNVNLFRGASYILPWSTWVRTSLINDYNVDPARIEVVPPGVDIEMWHPAHDNLRKPLRILFVGGDFYRKGGETLIRAFQRLPAGAAELMLVTRSNLPDMEGVTVFNNLQPNTPELINLYRSCDLFVLPTQAEAFGIAAIEASAAGLPVIATNVGGLVDIVEDGETGFLIPAGDHETLANRIGLLIENVEKREQMGRAARNHAIQYFDARKNANRVMAILKEAILS